jgi:hypothetical protein
MIAGRKRGVLFDVGHGAGSFNWNIAVPFMQQGFAPDFISTDLHTGSMNAGMKDMLNVMSKMLNLGMPLTEVIRTSTWAPAQIVRHPEIGHLSEGAVADVSVLRLDEGAFGFIDSSGARNAGNRRLAAEVTIRNGVVEWDLNGRAATDWTKFRYRNRSGKELGQVMARRAGAADKKLLTATLGSLILFHLIGLVGVERAGHQSLPFRPRWRSASSRETIMPVRLRDVANRLGISTAAVCKALKGHKDISEATRQRVLECVGS